MSLGPVRPIVVDDSNAAILYTGAWQAVRIDPNQSDRNNLPFLSTRHQTQTNGSISYTFKGSSATMFGSVTMPQTTASTRQMAPWRCVIDNAPMDAEYPETSSAVNWPFCHAKNLNDDTFHTLTMEVVGGQFSDLALDQIQYVPSPLTPIQHTSIKLAHDDPLIHYEGTWEVLPGMSGVSTVETTAEMHLSFYGSSITWMASTISPGNKPISLGSYSVDGRQPVNFLTTSVLPTSHLANQTIFRLEGLPDIAHNLLVTYNSNSSQTPLFFDYLIIENATINSTIAGSSTAIPTIVAPSPTVGNPSNAGNHDSTASQAKHNNLGAIIGGVIGGILFIGLGILFFIYLRHKKATRRSLRSSAGNRAWAERFNFSNDINAKGPKPYQLGNISSPISPSYPRFEEHKKSPTSPQYPFSLPDAATAGNMSPYEGFSPINGSAQK